MGKNVFDNREIEDNSDHTLHLKEDMFYPTIYHEDIEVVSAKVEDIYYEDKDLDRTTLTIKIEYRGEDYKLQGWYKEYKYRKANSDTWAFYNFEARDHLNFRGDDFKPDYLKIRL